MFESGAEILLEHLTRECFRILLSTRDRRNQSKGETLRHGCERCEGRFERSDQDPQPDGKALAGMWCIRESGSTSPFASPSLTVHDSTDMKTRLRHLAWGVFLS